MKEAFTCLLSVTDWTIFRLEFLDFKVVLQKICNTTHFDVIFSLVPFVTFHFDTVFRAKSDGGGTSRNGVVMLQRKEKKIN